jgi:hypothetical protein
MEYIRLRFIDQSINPRLLGVEFLLPLMMVLLLLMMP